jgi:hypothetical protein
LHRLKAKTKIKERRAMIEVRVCDGTTFKLLYQSDESITAASIHFIEVPGYVWVRGEGRVLEAVVMAHSPFIVTRAGRNIQICRYTTPNNPPVAEWLGQAVA